MSVTDLIRSLRSTQCPACKGRKQSRHSFCGGCYRSLPATMQAPLYDLVGRGYEQAYAEASEYLRDLNAAVTEGELR